jgi:hypothetical protein
MAQVTFAADDEVFDLLDIKPIEQKFGHLNVNIIFSCVNTDDWSDDSWITDEGIPSHIIKLPFDKVKSMNKEQVRELMLQKAQERLQQAA